jgi:DNA-binding phage protein
VAIVPVPGLDWLADVSVLMKLIPEINRAFGLSPDQVARLSPDRRVVVYKALSAGGSLLVGRIVTRALVLRVMRLVGVRLTAQQVAKFVPIAGQAVSAALTFTALRYVCEQHIQQCIAVSEQLRVVNTEIPG